MRTAIFLAPLLVIATTSVSVLTLVAQPDGKKVGVALAERTELFGTEGSPGSVSSSDGTIVLVITVSGIDQKEWDKLYHEDFHLTAGTSRYEFLVKTIGVSSISKND